MSDDPKMKRCSLWGGVVSERKSLTITMEQLRDKKLLISQATLGEVLDCHDDPGEEEGRTVLSFKIGDCEEVILCSLRLKNKEMYGLDIELHGLADVIFSAKGRRQVHLVGSYSDLSPEFANQSVNHGVVHTEKNSASRIPFENGCKDSVQPTTLPPNEVRIPCNCCSSISPTFSNYMLHCLYPAHWDVPKPPESRTKLLITSKSFQRGSLRRKLDYDTFTKNMRDSCKKSEEQVVEKAAASPRMKNQIKSLGTISTNEPSRVVERSEEVVAAEQVAFETTQVTSSKYDSNQVGKFETESEKHFVAMPIDALCDAAKDDHNCNGRKSKKEKKQKKEKEIEKDDHNRVYNNNNNQIISQQEEERCRLTLEYRHLGSTEAEAKETRDSLSRISGVICTIPPAALANVR